MLMRKLNWIGIYIVMFVQIVRTFLKVVLSLTFAVIGFAISFHMLLENTVSFLSTESWKISSQNLMKYVLQSCMYTWPIFWSTDRFWEFRFSADLQISRKIGKIKFGSDQKICRNSVETTNQNSAQILASGIYLFLVYLLMGWNFENHRLSSVPAAELMMIIIK